MTRVSSIRRTLLPALLVLAVATAVATAPAAEAGPREVPRGFFGVMYDSVSLAATDARQVGQHALMARSGVETVRIGFVWEFLQAGEGDSFDFTYTDRYVRYAATHGLDVLPVMLYAPPWARIFPGRRYSPPETRPYLEFLRASIRRYGSRGSFWREHPGVPRRPLRDWQVWNEPSIRGFWDVGRANARYGFPHGYAQLLRASHRVIKRTDARARTVMAGMVGAAWKELRLLYRAGMGNAFDVAAVHVYPQNAKRVAGALRLVRAALDENGGKRKRIYLTETAFPASRGRVKPISNQRQESRNGMAKLLADVYERLIDQRKALGLDKVFWYTWATSYTHPSSNFEYSGLLRAPGGRSFTPQPALSAYRRTARRYQGCAKTSRGACR